MINVTDRFLVACKESGQRVAVADLYYNHGKQPVVSGLPITGWTVTQDSTAAQRSTASLTLTPTDLISFDPNATLQPYGLEIGIRIGVVYPDGTSEYVQKGIYQITDLSFDDENGDAPTVTLADRSTFIAEQSSSTGIEDYSGKGTMFAIQDLLTKSVFINVDESGAKVDPLSLGPSELHLVIDHQHLDDIKIPGASPMDGGSFWDDIQTLSASLGAECYFDDDGCNVILQKIPDITNLNAHDDAVLIVDVGAEGVLLSAQTGLSRSGAYNAVQMTGALPANATATATPPTVFVFDSDPTSPTFYDNTGGTNGPFGRIVHAATSDTITDKTALKTAALALLKKGIGLTKTLSFSMLANYALEIGDIILVKHLNGDEDLVMVTGITFQQDGSMSVSTKCPNQIETIDTGTGIPDGGGGGIIPTPPPGSLTKTYKCTWSQSYNQAGAKINGGSHTFAYQGNDGKDGNRMSLLGFNFTQIQTDIGGHDIISCTITLYYQHWWYPSGGTSLIGTHDSASAPPLVYPTTFGGRVNTANWPRPGQKTINLGLDIGKELRDGTATGLALGSPGVNTNKIYYGYASGFGATKPPVLTIVYAP